MITLLKVVGFAISVAVFVLATRRFWKFTLGDIQHAKATIIVAAMLVLGGYLIFLYSKLLTWGAHSQSIMAPLVFCAVPYMIFLVISKKWRGKELLGVIIVFTIAFFNKGLNKNTHEVFIYASAITALSGWFWVKSGEKRWEYWLTNESLKSGIYKAFFTTLTLIMGAIPFFLWFMIMKNQPWELITGLVTVSAWTGVIWKYWVQKTWGLLF